MEGSIGASVHAFDAVDSTQAVLGRLAREGAPEGTVVTARHQDAGRGRRGRQWWDAPGEALLFSVLLRPSIPVAHVPQLSLVAALAVTDALDTVGVAARIRWPNDVLVEGRKICGILPDATSAGGDRVAHVALGIGINVNQLEFPGELEDRATSILRVTGQRHDPAELLPVVLQALDRRYRDWLHGGFARARDEWRRRSSTLGQWIDTPEGGGVAIDVAEDGALLVDRGGVLVRVVSLESTEVAPAIAGPGGEGGRDAARH